MSWFINTQLYEKYEDCLRFACSADPSLNIGTSAYNWAGDSWTFQRRWSGVWGLGGLWGCGLQGFRCSGVEGFWDWVEGFSGVWGSEVWALEV